MLSRQQLLTIYSQALNDVKGQKAVRNWLSQHPLELGDCWVIAIGKAAESMCQGVYDCCAGQIAASLIITKYHHLSAWSEKQEDILCIEAGHPYPDDNSLLAGHRLVEFLQKIPKSATVLFLVSGGASSLVEIVPDGTRSAALGEFNQWLIAQGWPIEVMNYYRKTVSLIKGGRLARYLHDRQVIQLLISDVPKNDLSVIGSGLLVADESQNILKHDLPDWVTEMQKEIPEKPRSNESCFENIQTFVIADNETLRNSAAEIAKKEGLPLRCNQVVVGNIEMIADEISQKLLAGDKGIYIWGGEGVIKLPDNPGRGGRCQALALMVANKINGHNNICVLAAGTDGTDGPGDVAGAIVDGQTITRGIDGGLDVIASINNADAGSFLAESGDLLDTGPTGTNVMDIILAIKH